MSVLKLDSIHQGRHPNYFRYVALIEHILQCTTALHREDLNTNLHWEMQERDSCSCCAKKSTVACTDFSIGPLEVSSFCFLLNVSFLNGLRIVVLCCADGK